MALVAGTGRRGDRSDRQGDRADQAHAGFAPADRLGVESGRGGEDGAAAVPLPLPVLCRQWAVVVPALSTLRRHFLGRAVQYRVLRVAAADGGAGHRSESRRLRALLRRCAFVFEPSRAGRAAAVARAPSAAAHASQSGGQGYLRLQVRGFPARRLSSASAYRGAGGGVSADFAIRRARREDRDLIFAFIRELAEYEKLLDQV